MKPKIYADLRNILATLYPDERSIRRVVDDAGIDSSKMVIDAHALNSWHFVLAEAEKNHQVEALLEAVKAEYKNNQPFLTAYHAYGQSVNRPGGAAVDSQVQKMQGKPTRQWLSVSIVGLLLVGIAGSGWYWGIPGLRNPSAPLTATPTIAETSTSTLISNLSKSVTLTPVVMEQTSILSTTSMTALPTNTPIAISTTMPTVTPTPQPTATVTATPTLQPTATVIPTHVATYPCDAEVYSKSGATKVNIAIRTNPAHQESASAKDFVPGTTVLVYDKYDKAGVWYKVYDTNSRLLGWMSSEYLSSSCLH